MQLSHKKYLVRTQLPESVSDGQADVIVEAPIDISINAKYWLTLMCTPLNLEELAIGFVFNEGLVNHFSEIKLVDICGNGSNIDIWLDRTINFPSKWKRTSGCSGGTTSVNFLNPTQPKPIPTFFSSQNISKLLDLFYEKQDLYAVSGGVHSSALCDGDKLLVSMEDIGRHNTLDKIAGWCVNENTFPNSSILISTGRISSEMLQKAARIGSSIIISRTSPSSLSIELAEQMGICIVGYARRDRFKIFSHPEYIETPN